MFRTHAQLGSVCCFVSSACDRRLEWVGQSSSWWLTWRTWGDDMTGTWPSWRRPRRRSSSRPPAGTPSIPEHPQVSDTVAVCLVVFVFVRYLTDHWISCCRSRGKWEQKEELSAGMQIFGPLFHLIRVQLHFHHFNLPFICVLRALSGGGSVYH